MGTGSVSERRIAITGVGIISPIGLSKEDYWDGLIKGRSGAARITHFDPTQYTSQIACEVKGFEADKWMDRKLARRIDPFTQFGLAAATDALKDAGLDVAKEDPTRIGVVIGTGIGGLTEIEEQHTILLQRGPGRVSPFLVPKLMANACSGQVALSFGFQGPNFTCLSACASSNHSLIEAMRAIERGEADIMVSGGAEAAVTPLGVAGFCSLKALSTRNDEPTRASRPFEKNRDGFVIGEGSGVIIMEELGHARARGAHIYGLVLGGGMSCDAFHITQPDPDGKGAVSCMTHALEDAGVNPDQVTYVNAHGTSTEYNDATESLAIGRVFGDHARKLQVSSTKSMVGHLLGGSGGVEIVACALMLDRGVIHPTINYETPDPACQLDYVPNTAREAKLDVIISNSFGFGGHNASVVIGRMA
jgi:3-oxoacyl-[acyl-carrier-protein] synthase II